MDVLEFKRNQLVYLDESSEIEFINAEYKFPKILVSEFISIMDLILIKLYCEYDRINELKDMLVRPIKKLIQEEIEKEI